MRQRPGTPPVGWNTRQQRRQVWDTDDEAEASSEEEPDYSFPKPERNVLHELLKVGIQPKPATHAKHTHMGGHSVTPTRPSPLLAD